MADTDKTIIASSEFDPSNFVRGIDLMAAALENLAKQEGAIQTELKTIDAALRSNRNEYRSASDQVKTLDKNSNTYKADLAALTAQKKLLQEQFKALKTSQDTQKTQLVDLDKQAQTYKTTLQTITTVTKQVADQNKGKQFFDVVSISDQVREVTAAGARLKNIFQGKIDTSTLDKFEKELSETTNEFEELAKVVEFSKQQLSTLDPNSEEFADLNKIIETGEQVLAEYGKTVEDTGKKTGSLRSQLAQMKNELSLLEEQGKENTDEFQNLAVAAGKLEDQLGDTRERIRVLASDTKAVDFGLAAIRGVTAAFGVAEGAAALFGLKNEDVAETIKRLNSIMLILNGVQELQNLLKKENVIITLGEIAAKKAAAAAERIFAFAVGTSTGALKAFKVALLATGIGIFIVLLGAAADAMGLFGSETEDAVDANEDLKRSLADLGEELDNRLLVLRQTAELSQAVLERQGATEKQLSEDRIKSLNREKEELNKIYADIRAQQQKFLDEGQSGDAVQQANQQAQQIFKQILTVDQNIRLEKEKSLTKTLEDNRKATEKQKQLYEDYLNRITELNRQFRDKVLAAQPQDEGQIRLQFAQQLSDAVEDLNKEVQSGKLTQQRANILFNLIKQNVNFDSDAAVKELNDRIEESEREFAQNLFDLRLRSGQERANLIRDQFTREAAIVRIEARQQSEELTRERDDLIRGINETAIKQGLDPQKTKENVDRITEIYRQLLENVKIETSRKQEEISKRLFETAQTETSRIFSSVQLIVSETATQEIVTATKKFEEGKISYAAYQKELTRIAEEESARRIATAIREQQALLKPVQQKIAEIQAQPEDTRDNERLKELQDQETQIRGTISDLTRQEQEQGAEAQKKGHDARTQRIQQLASYAQAIGGIISQVVGFWQQANEAERASLEESIRLQETRVAAAQKLAERGNAEFLRLEEDRLNELTLKQENAARRQIAINAVLQTSQALTAFVSALAQGIATGGPIGGLAIATAVIAAIASGFAIIQSIQPKQSLKQGTKKVERKDSPRGVDTVPAMLTEGEAVIPVSTNKEYEPAVEAIYDRKIPAQVLNNFVKNYNVAKPAPMLSTEKLQTASEVRVQFDGELLQATKDQNRKLEENNERLGRVEKAIAGIRIEANIDRNGLGVALLKAFEQHRIDKNA